MPLDTFLWSWLDKYDDEDVRLPIYPLSPWKDPELLLQLEATLIRATEPPHNVQIPSEPIELIAMKIQSR